MQTLEQTSQTLPASEAFRSATPVPSEIPFLYQGKMEVADAQDRFIIHGTEFLHYNPDSDDLVGDLERFDRFTTNEPELANLLGISLEKDQEQGEYYLTIPKPEELNKRRAAIPDEVGINKGQFVAVDADVIDEADFLGFIAKGEIPAATQGGSFTHDIGYHMIGYALMSDTVFKKMQATAQEALASGKRSKISAAMKMLEFGSTGVTDAVTNQSGPLAERVGDSTFSVQPGTLPLQRGIRAGRDKAAQAQTFARLEEHLEVINNNPSSAESGAN